VPAFGKVSAHRLSLAELEGVFEKLADTPATGNRLLAATSSMYGFAAKRQMVPKGTNPSYGIERYPVNHRDRHLSMDELEHLGAALHLAETEGVAWVTDPEGPRAKHLRKDHESQRSIICPYAIAAIRLLLFTGCRLGEILNLEWSQVDFENRLLHLPNSKTGKKKVVLNSAAIAILKGLTRAGSFVIVGNNPEKARTDLAKPWAAVKRTAALEDFKLHDLRHSFASVGTASGTGLPIVAKLLGHASIQMTERYSHLDADPLRRASNRIAKRIAKGLDKGAGNSVKREPA
jgi:integrase